ncbi:hypothetical protein [Arthrobacter sp. zg-Y1110]|uniref:hypothetical protein n=1 Tax=Arthrobacter sp. zg-Y1110 TaxID=2886932 RepID=UPI001D15D3B3|nr:hypothetical protein [Arthrobacter sp. zg-Y1110]MCC3290268.1 hypothetical protein [Arthrobacter sp. zg-Y1110]UWX84352.1 hypothetical protein N2K99_12815 [Arthrobacter sp. zg-Y1110]
MGVFLLFLAAAAASFAVGRAVGKKAARPVDGQGRPLPPPAQIYEDGYRAGFNDAAVRFRPPATVHVPEGSAASGAAAVAPAPAAPAPGAPAAPAPGAPAAPAAAAAAPAPAPAPTASYVTSYAVPSSPSHSRSAAVPPPGEPAGHPSTVAPVPAAPNRNVPVPPRPAPPRPAPPRPAPPVKTEAELKEEKRRRDLRNINITLYSASLLLVAAAALFIGLAIPAEARFFGVVAVTALFYVSGLVIHARSARLRPAAVAFTGTGLALIPVVGLALFNFVLPDGPAAWLVTSVVGTAAFAYAAAKIESRVVTYLALTFLLSSGLASGAALRWGIVWYFLFTVILATLISLAAIRRPGWLNNLYVDAFVRSHRYLVPATAIASVQISGQLSAAQLGILFLAFALYYAVMLWQGPARHQLVNSYGLRAAGTVGLTSLFYSFTDSTQLTLLAFAVQVAVQTAGVLARRPMYGAAALLQVAAKSTGLPLDRESDERPRPEAGADSTGDSAPLGTAAGQGEKAVPLSAPPAPPAPSSPAAFTPAPASDSVAAAAATVSLKKPAVAPEEAARRFFRVDVAALLVLQACTALAAGLWHVVREWESSGSSAAFAGTAVVVLVTYLAAAWKLGGRLEYAVLVPAALAFVPNTLMPGDALWPGVLSTAVLAGYLVVRAVRGGAAERLVFVLAARAAAILLVALTVLASLAGIPGVNAGAWALATAVLALTANQAVSVVRTRRAKPERFPGAAITAAAAAAAVLTLLLRFQESPGLVLTLLGLWTVVAGNVLTSTLRPGGRYLIAAPAGFAAAALMGAGVLGVRGYELLAAAALCYCAVLAWKLAPRTHRTYYLAAGQTQLTALSALIAADLGAGVHGIFIAMAVCLAAQHLLRVLLDRKLRGLGLSQTLLWATVTVLAVLPPLYYLLTYTAARSETGVVLLLIGVGSAVLTQGAYTLAATGRTCFGERGAAGTGLPGPAAAASGGTAGVTGRMRVSGTKASIGAAAAAGLVLLLEIGVRAAEGNGAVATVAVLAAALAVNVFTALMLRRSWPALTAPAGFTAVAVVGAGVLGIRGYEILVLAALAYCTYLVLGRSNPLRGAYLLAAHILAVVLAGLAAADLTGDVHQVFAAVAVGIAVGQVLRTVFARLLEPLGLASWARWGGLAASTGVPLAYIGLQGPAAQSGMLMFLVLCAAGVAVFSQLAAVVRVRRGRPLKFAAEFLCAAALVALLATAASRGVEGHGTGWTLALLWTALAANAATSLLLPDRYEAAALAGFAAAAAVGAGVLGLRGYELLVLAALAYSAYLALKRSEPNRGLYLLGVQGLLVVQTVLVAADLGVGMHGLYIAGAMALAIQQLIRTLLHRRLDAHGYSETSQWLSIALLALLPIPYGFLAGTAIQRDVVALHLFLLLITAAAAFTRRRAEGHPRSAWVVYPAAYALGALGLVLANLLEFSSRGAIPEPLLATGAAGSILLILAAAALCGEARRSLDEPTRTALLAAAIGYTAAVLAVSPAADSRFLPAAAFVLGAAIFLVVSSTRSLTWLAVGTPVLLTVGMLFLFRGLFDTVLAGSWDTGFASLLPLWVTAAVLQAIRLLTPARPVEASLPGGAAARISPSQLRRRILGSASALIPALAAIPAMAPDSSAAAGALTVVAALALALLEVPARFREPAVQAAVLVTALAVQRMGWLVLGNVNGFWSLQYWATVLAGLAAYEFLRKRDQRGTAVLVVSAVILSASGLSTVIFGGGGKQLWALVAHAGLLAFGLLASRRLFTLWGAAGVVLAVLWYLRGYTFLLLALLGIGLIALAVWRLTRVRTDDPGNPPVQTTQGTPPAIPVPVPSPASTSPGNMPAVSALGYGPMDGANGSAAPGSATGFTPPGSAPGFAPPAPPAAVYPAQGSAPAVSGPATTGGADGVGPAPGGNTGPGTDAHGPGRRQGPEEDRTH